MDELGRGTATTDGAAIASSVLDHLATTVRCRGVFATHYHHISDGHASDPAVAIKHMACAVTPAAEPGGVDEVAFLHRLTAGACPKSYGVNVARLAGLPESVVRRAAIVSEEAEARGERRKGVTKQPAGLQGGPAAAEVHELETLRRRVLQACAGEGASGAEDLKAAWAAARHALGISS